MKRRHFSAAFFVPIAMRSYAGKNIMARNFQLGFTTLIFLAFFAHLPDLGGDTPTRLLFGWGIAFALLGFFGLHALRQSEIAVATPVIFALLSAPLYFLTLGAFGHVVDASYAWTPALVVFTIAALHICLSNAGLNEDAFDKILSFAVLTQALILLGSKDFPLLAHIPGPISWPSRQPLVYGGYWQVNVMANILACLCLWTVWQTARRPKCDVVALMRMLCAVVLFPLVIGWSRSFSGLLFLPAGLAFLAVVNWRQPNLMRRSYFLGLSAVGLACLFSASFAGVGIEQAPETVAKAQASSAPDRIGIWLRSFYAFIEAPIFGHGLGNFGEVYNAAALAHADTQAYRWINNTRHAHNIVVHNLVEIGLVGTLILLLPFIWFGTHLLRRVPQHWATVAILTPLLGHIMTGYPQRQSVVPLLLILLVIGHISVVHGQGTMRRLSLARVSVKWRLGLLAAFVLPAITASVWTAIDYAQASQRHMVLAHPRYHPDMVKWRLSQPDLQHPFLKSNADVQSIFALSSRAMQARDKQTLRLLLPLLEAHEARFIRGGPTWNVLVRGNIIVGDLDKARDTMAIAYAVNPSHGRALMQELSQELKKDRQYILAYIAPNPRRAE